MRCRGLDLELSALNGSGGGGDERFEDVKEEFERIGEGRPSFHIVLDVDEAWKS